MWAFSMRSPLSDTWYYPDIHAYERALKKSNGKAFAKKREYLHSMEKAGYFAAQEYNGTFDQTMMYEVFLTSGFPECEG